MDLYENQKYIETIDMVVTQYLCVHDDTFGRCFDTAEEIWEYIYTKECKDYNFNIEILSKNIDGQINVFILNISCSPTCHSFLDPEEGHSPIYHNLQLQGVERLQSVLYYTVTPCNFNIRM